MKRQVRKISALLLSIILILSCLSLSGCMGFFNVSVQDVVFTADGNEISELSLALGERVELNRYVSVLPSRAQNKAFTVTSSDYSVVSIEEESAASGNVARIYATAVAVGEATLTAITVDGGKTAALNVKVLYASPQYVEILPSDDLNVVGSYVIMQEDAIVPAKFTARSNDNADPDLAVVWRIDGDADSEQTLAARNAFTYTPQGVGQTEITATVTDGDTTYADTVFVNVYDPITDAAIEQEGNLEQDSDACTQVSFTMTFTPLSAPNPDPIVLWTVNGESVKTGMQFDFMPSDPGIYKIEGTLNGQSVQTFTVKVRGEIVPKNVWLDYDNCYPQVWVRWDEISAAAGYEVYIANALTGRVISQDITTKNTALRNKFTSSGVNITEFLGSYNVFNTQFSVKVKTLPDAEGILKESAWSAVYRSQQVPYAAKPFLQKSFYDGARNYYVKSYDEFYEWFEYAMLWRPSEVSSDEGETLYFDYSFTSASDVIEQAMAQMHFTGQYSYSGANIGKECTFRIVFGTDGAPSKRTSNVSSQSWDAMRPHVNYDTKKARSAGYAFPIDGKTPVTVETSDQLYYVAQLGYRPLPKSNSAAAQLYSYARNTLRYIITDDMTDVQKIHAIYDWIMWRVLYDDAVLKYSSLKDAVQYESYYLESVFTDKNYYGVCDAMSKAFVLMASIEGFESVRVTGDALSGGVRGGHAWNKVKLYGQWYVVDCTWGDFSVQLMNGGAYCESASHLYFLLSDADIKGTHFEDANSSFPATAKRRYAWYAEETVSYNGADIDMYLSYTLNKANMQKEMNTIAKYMTQNAKASERTYYVYPCQTNAHSSYYGYEIVADGTYGQETLREALQEAMKQCGYTKDKDYFLVQSDIGSTSHLLVYISMR